jgi:hypothetical protein
VADYIQFTSRTKGNSPLPVPFGHSDRLRCPAVFRHSSGLAPCESSCPIDPYGLIWFRCVLSGVSRPKGTSIRGKIHVNGVSLAIASASLTCLLSRSSRSEFCSDPKMHALAVGHKGRASAIEKTPFALFSVDVGSMSVTVILADLFFFRLRHSALPSPPQCWQQPFMFYASLASILQESERQPRVREENTKRVAHSAHAMEF